MGSFKIRLHGEVEVDKFYIGNKKGRSSEKALVIVAAENRMPNKRRFFILERVSDASTQSIAKCIMKNIKKGSIIRTDTWSGYNDINNKEYFASKVNFSTENFSLSFNFNGILLNIFSLPTTYYGDKTCNTIFESVSIAN